MDKGFRRIALTLMGITALSVVLVGVYLWYNFNARSNLVLVVPEKTEWFIHVQTKQWMKAFQDESKPKSLMEFESKIKAYPLFRGIASPKEVGVSPHSDWIFFGKGKVSFMALSVFSEPALESFCNRLVDSGYLHPAVKNELFIRYKIAGKNAYVAFKHKALVIGMLLDTTENATEVQRVFSDVFSGKSSRFMENSELQALYEQGEALVAWKTADFNIERIESSMQGIVFPFNQSIAVALKEKRCFVYGAATAKAPVLYWNPDAITTTIPEISSKLTSTLQTEFIKTSAWQPVGTECAASAALEKLLQSTEKIIHRFNQR